MTATHDERTVTAAVQSSDFAVDDVKRAREFYRYIQPDNLVSPQLRRRNSTFDEHHDHIPSLSHALSPFCQLAAMRCDASKAMLNVMDREKMYFLAEASMRKSSSGAGETLELVEDPIMASCTSVGIKDRICELTLRLEQPEDAKQVPVFVINDLSQSQFAKMEIIAGPPFYRFYAGVPIKTRDGINIGSLAVMDTRVRKAGLTQTEEAFLGKTAEQIMTYLETNRQAIEGRRSRRMAEGLEGFISGKRSIHEESPSTVPRKMPNRRPRATSGIPPDVDNEAAAGLPMRTARTSSIISIDSDISSCAQSVDEDDQQDKSSEGEQRSHSKTFARAANLLRESLGDLGEDGIVLFLSLSARLGGCASHNHTAATTQDSSATSLNGGNLNDKQQNGTSRSHVLARSTSTQPFQVGTDGMGEVTGLDDELLRELLRRYPGGRLWSFDESGSSSSEDDLKHENEAGGYSMEHSRRRNRRKWTELKILRAAFPSAKQVMFSPVWDAAAGSFAYGCFVTTALETRSFSSVSELPFLNSFCSTVMAECSRLDTMMADRQKSDFVGTISHEMRSPLHGVLASVEFLAETDITSFQRSLVETIESCGRTLLDTINHVLDFSKVNSFQKQWQASNKRNANGSARTNYLGPENSSKVLSFGAPPLLQLFACTDVSLVLEEVIDGLVLGNTYNSGIDITDTSREARGVNGDNKASKSLAPSGPVEVVLDLERGDWTFITQPGAVRRIIMNITGNAIKYTNHGIIKVQLSLREARGSTSDTQLMIFTVSDTGKGISSEFLNSRLFMPFAQENALAPGTGLGMSIVRSIVLMLGGTIDVKSKVGVGTTVEVALPLKRPLPGQVSTLNTPHSGATAASSNSAADGTIPFLQSQASDTIVSFYGQNSTKEETQLETIEHYVRDWYGLKFVDQRFLESSSIVIINEHDLEHFLQEAGGTPGRRPALVVMCSVSSRHSAVLIRSLEERLSSPVEFIAKPCGPNKLARSIRQALEKQLAIKPRHTKSPSLGAISEFTASGVIRNETKPSDPAGNELQETLLGTNIQNGPTVAVQATENFAASQLSQHAQMAINDPLSGLRTPRAQMSDSGAFPFPTQPEEKSRQRSERNSSGDVSFDQRSLRPHSLSFDNDATPMPPDVPLTALRVDINPHVLLVDDNQINLKLLETFLKKKRNYTRISKAEDGQQAVECVMGAREQFDIIFMDISMPIMNGFEATRVIRRYEQKSHITPGAMVIALTGLASGRDQSEGFDSGCDIYMTKPVSFKEVGRLLDNWEGHQKISIKNALNGQVGELDLDLNLIRTDIQV